MQLKPYSFKKLIKNASELETKAAIIPTDTVMGIVSKSPEIIYQIKNRSAEKKLVTFINNINKIEHLLPNEIQVLEKYWPGQLTIIKNGVSYRMPYSKKILKLIERIGPLYSSSANISGKPSIKKARDVFNTFEKDLSKIFIVKGREHDNYPSTIVDFDKLTVVRRGRLDGQKVLEDLREFEKK